jgi:AAA domain-containing protein
MTPTPTSPLIKPPALTTKPTPPTPAAEAAKAAFTAKPRPARVKITPKTLADEDAGYIKILAYGHTGTGKTLMISGLLEAGLKVLAISTDFGGHGFTSVQQDLKDKGRADLLKNCTFFEFDAYDDLEDFVFNPTGVYPELWDVDYDVVFTDGFSGMQMCLLQTKILGTDSLFLDQQGWGRVQSGTTKILGKILGMKNENNGHRPHKIVVCHENAKAKEDKVTGETRIGPLLQGAGASLIEMSFDIIFRTRKKRITENGKTFTKYYYEMAGTDNKILTKARGIKVEPTEPGDFGALWQKICLQKGFASGKR